MGWRRRRKKFYQKQSFWVVSGVIILLAVGGTAILKQDRPVYQTSPVSAASPTKIRSAIESEQSIVNTEVIWVGDSTSDINLTAPNSPTATLYGEFKENWTQKGKPLSGVKSTVFAKSGATIKDFLDNNIVEADFRGIDDVINYCNSKALENKIIVLSLGHNGGIKVKNWESDFLPQMKTLIDRLSNETKAYLILRMPNAWVTGKGPATVQEADDKTKALYNLYKRLETEYPKSKMLNVQDILNWKGGAYANVDWKPNTVYAVDDYVQSNEAVFRCITAGTSGETGPRGEGKDIADGTVKWQYVSYFNDYMGDWTHPNEKGYRAIANVVGESIVNYLATK